MNRYRLPVHVKIALVGLIALSLATIARAQEDPNTELPPYRVQPGDKLQISVWNEPDLQKELLVAPDGGIAFPLVGEMTVVGKPIVELRQEISKRLARFISEPIVTVTVSEILGNKIYVLGQVNRPGEYVVNPMVDVMQALSIAGGTTPYAALNDILILRRRGAQQMSIRFRYGDVSSGKNLELNIVLQSGDVVVVP
jgi:polysaccharide export outer membrane protein